MGKIIITTLLVLSNLTFAFAQRYLEYDVYNDSDYKADTIVLSDCRYIRDVFMGDVAIYLYNADNHRGRGEAKWKSGNSIDFDYNLEPVVLSNQQIDALEAIVNNAFTKEHVTNIGNDELQITLNISSTTRKITDVYFMFFPADYYAQIPIEVFRKIELQLKEDITFELTDDGCNMNYVYISWDMIPKGKDDGLTIPEDGGGMLTMPGGKLDGTIGGTIGTPSTTPTMP